MTFAWYAHLKNFKDKPLYTVIFLSWLIAFCEYLFMIPANRIGINYLSLPQLKVLQEIITMTVFAVFAVLYMKTEVTKDFVYAGICLIGAAYFMFKGSGT